MEHRLGYLVGHVLPEPTLDGQLLLEEFHDRHQRDSTEADAVGSSRVALGLAGIGEHQRVRAGYAFGPFWWPFAQVDSGLRGPLAVDTGSFGQLEGCWQHVPFGQQAKYPSSARARPSTLDGSPHRLDCSPEDVTQLDKQALDHAVFIDNDQHVAVIGEGIDDRSNGLGFIGRKRLALQHSA